MPVFDNLNYTHSAGVSPSVVQYYERSLLENMKAELVHSRDAQKRTLPLNNGKRVQFRRMTPFTISTTPLAEGITPAGQTLNQTQMTAMVKPYGRHVELTDEMDYTLLDNMHQETAKLLADQANLTLDTISRDAINAGMNVMYTGANVARGTIAATDVLTYAAIKKAVRTLKRNNAKPFSDGFFHAIVHPDVVHDLTSDAMWVDVAKYQDKQKVDKYELGTIYHVKFFESTNAKSFKNETYLYGAVESLVASAGYDVTNKCLTTATTITSDQARELTGKMVNVQYTKSATTYNTIMCVESVDYAAGKIYFRWNPPAAVSAEWTVLQVLTIVPSGGGASNAEVFSTVIYGMDAFGTIELGGTGKNVEVIINPPGSSGALDPLNQRSTIAWKVKGFCTTILQDDLIVRIESGATA